MDIVKEKIVCFAHCTHAMGPARQSPQGKARLEATVQPSKRHVKQQATPAAAAPAAEAAVTPRKRRKDRLGATPGGATSASGLAEAEAFGAAEPVYGLQPHAHQAAAMEDDEEEAAARDLIDMEAVIKVFCTHSEPNFSLPWQRKRQFSSSGSGFVIEGRRILTNAHCVDHHTQVGRCWWGARSANFEVLGVL